MSNLGTKYPMVRLNDDSEPNIVYRKDERSILHHIPTYPDDSKTDVVNMIIEIPKGTNRKMETLVGKFNQELLNKKDTDTDKGFSKIYSQYLKDEIEMSNPIIQDYKEGNFRTVPALHHKGQVQAFLNSDITEKKKYKDLYGEKLDKGYNLCSYGAIPRTFEGQNKELIEDNKERKNTQYKFVEEKLGQKANKLFMEVVEKVVDEKDMKNLTAKERTKQNILRAATKTKHLENLKQNLIGDGDPLDICLINDANAENRITGEIVPVEILGCLPMFDDIEINKDGEMVAEIDWKVIAQPMYEDSRHIKDLSQNSGEYRTQATKLKNWFTHYKDKLDEDKKKLKMGGVVVGDVLIKDEAKHVVEHCAKEYEDIVEANDGISKHNPLRESYTTPDIQITIDKFEKSTTPPTEVKPTPANQFSRIQPGANYYGGGKRSKYSRTNKKKKGTKKVTKGGKRKSQKGKKSAASKNNKKRSQKRKNSKGKNSKRQKKSKKNKNC